MKFSLGQLALASCVAAAPTALEPRVVNNDVDILNFALTLEHLEATFYKLGLAKFGESAFDKVGYVKRTHFNIEEISADETTHVKFLTDVIKSLDATPVKKCSYYFGLTDVDSFVDTASILEGVGVTAYLGAADLISDKAYLTPAGAILTVEARHNAYIRDNHQPGPRSPFSAPFDVPQTPRAVYTLASQFITKCPSGNPDLGLTPFPLLTPVSTAGNKMEKRAKMMIVRAGDTAIFEVPKSVSLNGTVYAAFAMVGSPVAATVKVLSNKHAVKITIPKGVAGQSYVSLYSSKTPSDASTIAGPAIVEIQSPYTYGGFPL